MMYSRRIVNGTLPSLVRALADANMPDQDFVDVFVLTYRYFTTTPQLLHELAERFDMKPPPNCDKAALDTFRKTTRRTVQVLFFFFRFCRNSIFFLIIDRLSDLFDCFNSYVRCVHLVTSCKCSKEMASKPFL